MKMCLFIVFVFCFVAVCPVVSAAGRAFEDVFSQLNILYMFEEFLGKPCIVRCDRTGVFYGSVIAVSTDGKIAKIVNARRMWFWSGAASLSQVANEGVKKPNECKFPDAVKTVIVTDAIEYLLLTEQALESLEKVPVWRI